MSRFARFFLLLFVVAAVVCIIGEYADYRPAIWTSKPLLMPALLLWLWSLIPQRDGVFRALALSLLFATAGDVSLLLAGRDTGEGAGWFEVGIGAFFIAQCAYIVAFRSIADGKIQAWRDSPLLAAALTAYVAVLMCWVLPSAPVALQIPVLAYGVSLYGAALMALNLRGMPGAGAVFMGVVLFVLSDSLIALNRFVRPLPIAGVWIMATYIAGQFLIAKGALRLSALKGR